MTQPVQLNFWDDLGRGFRTIGNVYAGVGRDIADWTVGAANTVAKFTEKTAIDVGNYTAKIAREDIGGWGREQGRPQTIRDEYCYRRLGDDWKLE